MCSWSSPQDFGPVSSTHDRGESLLTCVSSPAPAREICSWRLPGGEHVRVRLLQSTDRELEVRFLSALSERSRYFRLMTPLRHLSAELVTQLMDVDGDSRAALVATIAERGQEHFIAVVRYAQTDEAGTAELGVTVADAWQRRGVATRMLRLLIDYAREHGIVRLTGLVLPDNAGMLALARKLGFAARYDAASRLMRICRSTAARANLAPVHSSTRL